MNDRFLKALQCRNEGRPPVWLMRQAGRYLPEYRALRAQHSFHEMSHRPELITEVTLLPLRRFAFDAAIVFSDILVVAEAFGKPFTYIDGEGPKLDKPLAQPEDIARLPAPDLARLLFVSEGIKQLKPHLQVPLVGFCGGPFTVASYLIEGGTSRDFKKTKRWMVQHPDTFHQLLGYLADLSIGYLKQQVAAGADALQIFDSWAHVLANAQFREFSLAYLHRILEGVAPLKVPVILFCRGASVFADALADLRPAAVGLDWQADIGAIRRRIGPRPALQGNLDPDLLFAPVPAVQREVGRLLESMAGDPGYIFNLGHGIQPETPLEAVQALIDTVQAQRLGETIHTSKESSFK